MVHKYVNLTFLQLTLIFVLFYTYRAVKMPSVENAVKKRGRTPLDDKLIIIDDVQPTVAEKTELEVKPLVVLDKIPNVQLEFGGTCAVSMEQLT